MDGANRSTSRAHGALRCCARDAARARTHVRVLLQPPATRRGGSLSRNVSARTAGPRRRQRRHGCASIPATCNSRDRIQGSYRQDVAAAVGDVILKRRDRLFAYLLAVVVDDAARGRDPRRARRRSARQYAPPDLSAAPARFAHADLCACPCLVEADGSKLASRRAACPLQGRAALPQLLSVFDLLGLAPPASLATETIGAAWTWAIARWDMNRVGRRLTQPLAGGSGVSGRKPACLNAALRYPLISDPTTGHW